MQSEPPPHKRFIIRIDVRQLILQTGNDGSWFVVHLGSTPHQPGHHEIRAFLTHDSPTLKAPPPHDDVWCRLGRSTLPSQRIGLDHRQQVAFLAQDLPIELCHQASTRATVAESPNSKTFLSSQFLLLNHPSTSYTENMWIGIHNWRTICHPHSWEHSWGGRPQRIAFACQIVDSALQLRD